MDITMQVSLYPLKQASIGPTVRDVVRVFRESGLHLRTGAMSTLVWGEERHGVGVSLWLRETMRV